GVVAKSFGKLAAGILHREPKTTRRERSLWQVQNWILEQYKNSIHDFLQSTGCCSAAGVLHCWRGLSQVCRSFIEQNNVPKRAHIVYEGSG
ncbi:hypothetical protein FOZ63_022199, partial [Perkinsus olseni]